MSCFFFYIGPNFYSILIYTSEGRPSFRAVRALFSEEPQDIQAIFSEDSQSVQAILQIVLLTLIWFAGVSEVVESRFFRFTIFLTLTILLATAQALFEDDRTAMHFLAPMAHCLGCLVGTVFGLYFNRLGINAVSGCLLGIISAALIMELIEVMDWICGILGGLVFVLVFRRFYLALFHYAGWVCPVLVFLYLLPLSQEDDISKLYLAFIFVGSVIGYLILMFTHHTIYGLYFGTIFGGVFTGCIGMLIERIAKKEYEDAILSSALVTSILFGAVGWHYFGLFGAVICAFTGYFMGVYVSFEYYFDLEVCRNGTGNLVLCFTCRSLGAGIGSLLVLPLVSFFDLLWSWLAEKAIRMFSLSFIQSGWQYTANLGAQSDIVYGAFMWMKQNLEGLPGSFGLSLAVLMGVGSGALLGGLCGHAGLMLANSSNDTRVAGWSLMVSGGVVGVLSAYSAFRLKVSVPVGALVGCSITAAFLLWRGGFHFKSYFQRTFQLGRIWEIFNRAMMER